MYSSLPIAFQGDEGGPPVVPPYDDQIRPTRAQHAMAYSETPQFRMRGSMRNA